MLVLRLGVAWFFLHELWSLIYIYFFLLHWSGSRLFFFLVFWCVVSHIVFLFLSLFRFFPDADSFVCRLFFSSVSLKTKHTTQSTATHAQQPQHTATVTSQTHSCHHSSPHTYVRARTNTHLHTLHTAHSTQHTTHSSSSIHCNNAATSTHDTQRPWFRVYRPRNDGNPSHRPHQPQQPRGKTVRGVPVISFCLFGGCSYRFHWFTGV